ncbi:restriction endonuclease subunit S [Flavobacterium cheongpyeongense]|uniref:Restriction endonuclease subunit S n=2 Tax=Flavobacterium cheongpyeongense TaxID=2212651 RepID=A0A2V4BQN7_9FLAO|nr:restriction endonuclease subunit S [Flavobacterium cheongpyeongense]
MVNSMQISKYITFVPFANFSSWDVKTYGNSKLSFNFISVKLNSVLKPIKTEWVDIKDDELYPILGVKGQGKGLYINRVSKGSELTMKRYQKSKLFHLFYCKVRTVGGQWGVVYPQFENSFGSSNMQYLKIELDIIKPEFLELLLKVKKLTDEWDKNAIGADGRHFTLSTLLNLEIPLPTIEEQNRIVANYNNKLQLAQQQEQQAKTLEIEIERYLFEELGVEKMIVKPFVKGVLNLFNFSEIFDRWDYNKGSSSVFSILHQSKYPVKTLDEAFNFTNRSWNKKAHKEKTFTYVEMGGIDAGLGIVESTNLEVSKAPSRATQTILTGDLIIGTTRPYLKKFAIVSEKNNENIASSAFQIIAPSENYCLDYLLEYIKSEFGVKQFEYYMTGALYPAITSKDLRKVLIPFPPVEKQKQISNHMNSLKIKIKELNALSAKNRDEAIVEFEKEIFN